MTWKRRILIEGDPKDDINTSDAALASIFYKQLKNKLIYNFSLRVILY